MQELEEIIQQAIHRNTSAFTILVHRFQDMAVGYAFAVLGDFQLAEDVAQEAFIQIYQSLPQIQQPQAFPGWFRKVLYKHCDRIIRRKQVVQVGLEAAEGVATPELPLAELVEVAELRQRVRTAILTLPEGQRQVVTLYYIADYSQKEIAAFLNVPETTVKKRLHDAKQRLKEKMLFMAHEYLQGNRPSKDASFQEKVLDFVAPDRAKHSEAIYALFEMAERPDTFQWRAGRLAYSHVDWQASRIGCLRAGNQSAGEAQEQIVAAMHVYTIAMRIGRARIRTAGFNCEVTHPAYADQRATLIESTVKSSLSAIREQGYDLAVSFDDEPFWLKQGFVPGWRALQWYVDVADLPIAPVALQLHRFEPNARADLAQLYNQTHATLTGTAERPTYLRNKHPDMFMGWYWNDAQGNPAGYISGGADRYFTLDASFQAELDRGLVSERLRQRFVEGPRWENPPLGASVECMVQHLGSQWLITDGERRCYIYKDGEELQGVVFDGSLFWVDEVAGDPALCLQALAQLARQWQCTQCFFDRLHYKSGVGKQLRQLLSCRIHTGTFSRAARSYIVRIINLQSLFQKLVPELTQRLQCSPYATWQGNLLITLEDGSTSDEVLLAIDAGNVTVVPKGVTPHTIRGAQSLAQLVLGSESPDEVVEMARLEVSGDATMLLPVLFPAQYPQMENQAL
ncbi:MAG: RNA polymerase sigma factor [Caldilineaceae bacterium]